MHEATPNTEGKPEHRKPATPPEPEELAEKAVGDYLTACRMTNREQIGKYLITLCSVALESQAAAYRLAGKAAFVSKTMPKEPTQLRPVQ